MPQTIRTRVEGGLALLSQRPRRRERKRLVEVVVRRLRGGLAVLPPNYRGTSLIRNSPRSRRCRMGLLPPVLTRGEVPL